MKRQGRKGFTLLEVMVALAIIASVVLTLLGSVNYHLGVVSAERDTTSMTLIAHSRLAELLNSGGGKAKSEGTCAPGHPELVWSLELLPTRLPELQKMVFRVRRTGDKREVTLVRYGLK